MNSEESKAVMVMVFFIGKSVALAMLVSGPAMPQAQQPVSLRVKDRVEPINVGDPSPEFSWLPSQGQRAYQEAYIDGLYADGKASAHASQQANAMMLALGLVPEERERGEIRIEWSGAPWRLNVTVPPNTRAEVHLPGAAPRSVGSGEHEFR